MGTATGTSPRGRGSSQLSWKEGWLSQLGLEMSLSDSAPLNASFQDAAVRQSQLHLPWFWRPEARRFTLLAHQGEHDTTLKSKWGP